MRKMQLITLHPDRQAIEPLKRKNNMFLDIFNFVISNNMAAYAFL